MGHCDLAIDLLRPFDADAMNFSKTRLRQRQKREANLEFKVEDGKTIITLPYTEKARKIAESFLGHLLKLLCYLSKFVERTTADGSGGDPYRISLALEPPSPEEIILGWVVFFALAADNRRRALFATSFARLLPLSIEDEFRIPTSVHLGSAPQVVLHSVAEAKASTREDCLSVWERGFLIWNCVILGRISAEGAPLWISRP
jgi:hypothetical protein